MSDDELFAILRRLIKTALWVVAVGAILFGVYWTTGVDLLRLFLGNE